MINIATRIVSNKDLNIISNESFDWNKYLNMLEDSIGKRVFDNWFKSCQFVSMKAMHLTFSVQNQFVQKWINDNYESYILNVCRDFNIKTYDIQILDEGDIIKTNLVKNENDNLSKFSNTYTFSNFVVGSSNEIAYAASYSIAENAYTDKISNPLFIYGDVGLGKTHLMHAIGYHAQKKYPNKRILYMSSEKFVQSFVRSLMNNSNDFRDLLRSVDMLMVDDIQFICGKNKTQEEFFNTFNILLENSKQVIISCDKPPSSLANIEERLKSRLAWGLSVDIHETNYELRLGILKSKVSGLGLNINDDILEFLAANIETNVRELEGALNKIVVYANLMKKDLNLINVKLIMKDIIKKKKEILLIQDIQEKVCNYYKTSFDDLLSSSRKRNLVKTRQIAMYLSKQLTNHSLMEISKNFNKKDHTTVLHAIQSIKSQYESDINIKTQIDEIIDLLT